MVALLTSRLDADQFGIAHDDYLSAVAILHAADIATAARSAPSSLTLDQLSTVAWAHGMRLEVTMADRRDDGGGEFTQLDAKPILTEIEQQDHNLRVCDACAEEDTP